MYWSLTTPSVKGLLTAAADAWDSEGAEIEGDSRYDEARPVALGAKPTLVVSPPDLVVVVNHGHNFVSRNHVWFPFVEIEGAAEQIEIFRRIGFAFGNPPKFVLDVSNSQGGVEACGF